MKKITLLSLFETLLHQSERKVVSVSPDIAEKASVPVQKMLEL